MRAIVKLMPAAIIIAPVAVLAADSVQLTPGRWEEIGKVAAMTFGGRSVPGDMFKGEAETTLYCILLNEAREPALFFRGDTRGDQCALRHKSVAHGRIAMSYACDSPDGTPETWTLVGTYAKASYHITWRINTSAEGQPVTITKTMEGRFVGRCTGDEKGRI